jgi:RND family efflux transporter MFP subunit
MRVRRCLLALGYCVALSGCMGGGPEIPVFPPPPVSISSALQREVTDTNDFTGRTAAVNAVKVRAHVWGYLQKINFQEGTAVKKNDVLFEIDARTYQAEYNKADANLAQAIAHRDRLQADADRGRRLLLQRAIGQEEYDKLAGDRAEAEAAVKVAEAMRASAQLNLDYTHIRAPISGIVSRALVTVGNLVESGEMGGTTLTSIVSVDPMYAYFDVDDQTFLRVRQLVRDASLKSESSQGPPVMMGLAQEKTGFPYVGTIDFVDNQVDPGTGTMKMRGKFANADGALTPGLFVKVRVPLGSSHQAILVTDRAIDTDQGEKVIYVVSDKNVVEKRPVKLGRAYDGLREITSGLKVGERVVVDGIQRVHDGITVAPREVEMPAKLEARKAPEVPNTVPVADSSARKP